MKFKRALTFYQTSKMPQMSKYKPVWGIMIKIEKISSEDILGEL